jgi:hypothetical protein
MLPHPCFFARKDKERKRQIVAKKEGRKTSSSLEWAEIDR